MNMQPSPDVISPVKPPELPSGLPPGREPLFNGEPRIILHGISWATYERLLDDIGESHAAHFAYDQGELEIMVPSERHEEPNRTLAVLVEVLAEELNIDLRRLGSTTFKREDLQKGFEPDSCFYIQREAQIRGKEKLDLTVDPPPDLIIEIDISSPSLNKFPIYAKLGIPELWRYDGERVQILRLANDQYEEVTNSIAFPVLTNALATQFLNESAVTTSTSWLRRVRQWVRKSREGGK
jgi:Uma2 family endonuclease